MAGEQPFTFWTQITTIESMDSDFKRGLLSGLPIAIGYFFTAIGLGLYATQNGVDAFAATALAFTSLSSTGTIMGLRIMSQAGTYFEIALSQCVINARYSLLSITLSQKLPENLPVWKKAIIAFGNTDENFAVAIHEKKLTATFFFALMILPVIGWTAGTYSGALFGNFMPAKLKTALGILIYAMLIAIITPDSKKNIACAFSVIISALTSSFIYFKVPAITSGFSVIIAAVLASVLAALFFPLKSEEAK